MKKIVLLLLAILLLSCGNKAEKEGIIEETWEIIDSYVDTLESTPKEAREVKNLLDSRNSSLQDTLQNR